MSEKRLTDEQLAEHGAHRLLCDEDGCEWCAYREAKPSTDLPSVADGDKPMEWNY